MVQFNHIKIKNRRKDYGYTQKRLAEISKVKSQSTISRLENGDMKDSIREFFKVMQVLNLKVTEVIEVQPCEKQKLLKNLNTFRIEKKYKEIEVLLESYPTRYWKKDHELFCHYHWYQAIICAKREEFSQANIFIDKALERIEATKHYKYILPEILLAKGNIEFSLGRNGLKYYEEARATYNPISSIHTYRDIVRMHYTFSAAYCRQNKNFLALEHLGAAIKELNQYDSNFMRMDIEMFKLVLFIKCKKEDVETQKKLIMTLAITLERPEYIESIKNLCVYE